MTDRRASTLAELDKAIEESGFKLSHRFRSPGRPVVVLKRTDANNRHGITHKQVDEAVAEYLNKGGKITKVQSTPLTSTNKVNLDSTKKDDLLVERETISSSDYLEDI